MLVWLCVCECVGVYCVCECVGVVCLCGCVFASVVCLCVHVCRVCRGVFTVEQKQPCVRVRRTLFPAQFTVYSRARCFRESILLLVRRWGDLAARALCWRHSQVQGGQRVRAALGRGEAARPGAQTRSLMLGWSALFKFSARAPPPAHPPTPLTFR